MSETREGFCSVQEALAELQAGRMIVLVDILLFVFFFLFKHLFNALLFFF